MKKDKVRYKRKARMRGYGPHKLFKMEIQKYLDKKEEEKDLFDINSNKWKGLEKK